MNLLDNFIEEYDEKKENENPKQLGYILFDLGLISFMLIVFWAEIYT